MIIDGQLSMSERKQGCNLYKTFTTFNAVSYICLADSLFILFALELGCPDYYVAILASFMYLGNMFMLFGKFLTRHFGASRTIGFCWIGRNCSALLTASAPLLAISLSPAFGIVALSVGAFLFYSFRSAGVVAMQPLIGEITSPGNRGKFTSSVFTIFNVMCLLTLGVIIVIFRYRQSVGVFQCILLSGAFIGCCATIFAFRIKESPIPRESASVPMRHAIAKVWGNHVYRKLLFANIAAFSGIMLIVPISMLALKEGYGVPDYKAMLYSLVQFCGGILISYISGLLSEETGPRPLAALYCALLAVVCVFWIAAPSEFLWFYPVFIFLLGGTCMMGLPLCMTHYFLISVDAKDRVGVGLFIAVVSGLCAGIAGAVIGSGLLKVLHWAGFNDPLNIYKIYFSVVLLLLIPAFLAVYRLQKFEDWEISDVLGLVFAPRDIRALFLINKLESVTTPDKENENINKLARAPSCLSEKKLLHYMDSPLFFVRAKAMNALQQMPFGEKAKEALIHELEFGEHTTAYIAASLLGEKGVTKAIPLLIKALDSKDNFLRGKAMLSLARLKEASAYQRIEQIFKESDNPRIIAHGAAALVEIGDPEALALLLDKAVCLTTLNTAKEARKEILLAIARIAGIEDGFYKFLKLYKKDRDEGVSYLMEWLNSLNDDKMCPDFKDALSKYYSRNIGHSEIVELLLKLTEAKKRKMIVTIDEFLKNTDANLLYPKLLYCIVAVFRKNGSL